MISLVVDIIALVTCLHCRCLVSSCPFSIAMVEPSLPSEGATAAASPALPRRLRARHKPFSARGNSSAFRRSFFVSVSARFETVSLLSFRLELVRFRDWDTGVFEIGLLPSGPIRSRFRGGASAALARGRTECRVRVTTLFKAITIFPRVLIFVFSFTRHFFSQKGRV